ncbi:MAG: hypothetical protein U0531_22310 [Dehalococcoidia bacterium]
MAVFRRVRDEIVNRVDVFVSASVWGKLKALGAGAATPVFGVLAITLTGLCCVQSAMAFRDRLDRCVRKAPIPRRRMAVSTRPPLPIVGAGAVVDAAPPWQVPFMHVPSSGHVSLAQHWSPMSPHASQA